MSTGQTYPDKFDERHRRRAMYAPALKLRVLLFEDLQLDAAIAEDLAGSFG